MSLTDRGHVLRLQAVLEARQRDARIHPGRKRGPGAQVHRRRIEGRTRQVVVRAVRAVGAKRWSRPQVAAALHVSPRTMERWFAAGDQVPAIRGRPAQHADAKTTHEIFALLQASGPGTGLPFLERQFPDVAREELRDLRQIYQEQIFSKGQVLVHALTWQRPGAVWAMDHAHAPSLAEGGFRHLLVVRDLGSGRQLLVLPVISQDTQPVQDALLALFLRHGAPLVLKSDNGSAFTSHDLREFLRNWKVEQLLSPPGLPSYNGAVEAGIGSLRTHAHYESARHDRVGQWTCDDVEAARQRCNLYGRPRGRQGPNPQELWSVRTPISPQARELFRLGCALGRWRAACDRGACRGAVLTPQQLAAVEREAITESLIGHEHLVVRERWISQPVTRRRARKIS
jgi:transposase InsO family protein